MRYLDLRTALPGWRIIIGREEDAQSKFNPKLFARIAGGRVAGANLTEKSVGDTQ
jgi:hypothetical protein